jgi:XTP/dITP diphosphohydrolase
MPGRLILLTTTHRVAAGLLTADAWDAVRSADVVMAAAGHPLQPALASAGVAVTAAPADPPLGAQLVARAADATVVWLSGVDGEPGLADEVATAVLRAADLGQEPPEVELLPGSWDVPGARLLDLVAVMDRLRSPGGCPWDAEQSHESLVTYLLEEAYETVESVETGDRDGLREELGDLLLQVVFHARIAQEHGSDPWGVDEVAAGIVAKLVSRHPHVFGSVDATTADEVEANWEQIKRAEKGRASAVDGVPIGQPALALASKLMSRAEQADVAPKIPDPALPAAVTSEAVGELLLSVVALARRNGVDAEAALREAARGYAGAVRRREAAAPAELSDGTSHPAHETSDNSP